MSNLLEVRDLCKSFLSGNERLVVLHGLSLDLAQGELAAITGVSGSGKSTLLHILGGMDSPDSGSVRVEGKELAGLSLGELSEFRNRTVGFVFQFHHLLPEFTALENVMMPMLLRGTPPAEGRTLALEMLGKVGLETRRTHRPGELSGGEQQRVALARALVGRPRILLADEPTGNLDPHTGENVGELFRSLHEALGLTSVLVTHNEKLARICSRIYRLESGRLSALPPHMNE
jgi:lipoprotein-releasing system ATP-binding protein